MLLIYPAATILYQSSDHNSHNLAAQAYIDVVSWITKLQESSVADQIPDDLYTAMLAISAPRSKQTAN